MFARNEANSRFIGQDTGSDYLNKKVPVPTVAGGRMSSLCPE